MGGEREGGREGGRTDFGTRMLMEYSYSVAFVWGAVGSSRLLSRDRVGRLLVGL